MIKKLFDYLPDKTTIELNRLKKFNWWVDLCTSLLNSFIHSYTLSYKIIISYHITTCNRYSICTCKFARVNLHV